MTDTTINDALVFPQDDGTGVSDGSEDYSSAAYFSALSKYQGYGSYVGEDNTGSATLQFNDVDTTNEQVDVGAGYVYIEEGSHTVQSGSQTTYDTTIPINTPYVVMLPSEVVDLGLGTDNVNDLWLAVDPTTNDDVYIRHGNGLSAPSVPSVKLGTVDTSSGATTRANDLSTTSNKSVSTGGADITNETLVSATLSTTQSISSGSFQTVGYDTEDKDEVSEFDTGTSGFSPSQTGWYLTTAAIALKSVSTGDDLILRLTNTTDSTTLFQNRRFANGASPGLNVLGIAKLDSSKTYKVRFRNNDSSCDITNNDFGTYLQIRSVFR
jgi:hypothetical protein